MMLQRLFHVVLLHDFRAHRAEFYRDLAEMFRRNEALIGFLEGEIANSQLSSALSRRRALRVMLRTHLAGENASAVSHLLGEVVPKSDSMMLMAVDRAEDKGQALLALADAVDRQQAMVRVVATASVVPLITLPICYALVGVLARVVLAVDQSTPEFAREALWEGTNGWARLLAVFADAHGGALCLAFLAAIVAVAASLPRWRGRWRCHADTWPVFSLYRDFQAGMLFSSLAMMLRSGQTLSASLEHLALRASPWMRWQLGRVLSALDEQPTAVLDAFRRGLLSRSLLARAMTLNRSSSTFSEVLVQLGTREGERVLDRVKVTARIANVAVLGVLVGAAVFLGVASITVPGRFAALMEPSMLMILKARYDASRAIP